MLTQSSNLRKPCRPGAGPLRKSCSSHRPLEEGRGDWAWGAEGAQEANSAVTSGTSAHASLPILVITHLAWGFSKPALQSFSYKLLDTWIRERGSAKKPCWCQAEHP